MDNFSLEDLDSISYGKVHENYRRKWTVGCLQWWIQDFPGGANQLFGIIFAKNYMKMKKDCDGHTNGNGTIIDGF